jgi:hypothetical protein|tara:strand:- start:8793 stop:9005 length:213 start_codon:yes stop_codon:yes gene_type:complete
MVAGASQKHIIFQFKLEDGSLSDYLNRKRMKIRLPKMHSKIRRRAAKVTAGNRKAQVSTGFYFYLPTIYI